VRLFYPIGEEEDSSAPNPGDLPADCQDAKVRLNPDPPAEMPLYHPRSIEEAVRIILGVISDTARDMLRAVPRDERVVSTHFGLGTTIRNCMIHSNTNQRDLLADYQRVSGEDASGPADPDSVRRSHVTPDRHQARAVKHQINGDSLLTVLPSFMRRFRQLLENPSNTVIVMFVCVSP